MCRNWLRCNGISWSPDCELTQYMIEQRILWHILRTYLSNRWKALWNYPLSNSDRKRFMRNPRTSTKYLIDCHQLYVRLSTLRVYKQQIEEDMQKLQNTASKNPKDHALQDDVRRAMWTWKFCKEPLPAIGEWRGLFQLNSGCKQNMLINPGRKTWDKNRLVAELQKTYKLWLVPCEWKCQIPVCWKRAHRSKIGSDWALEQQNLQTTWTLSIPVSNADVDRQLAKFNDMWSATHNCDIKENLENQMLRFNDQQQILHH